MHGSRNHRSPLRARWADEQGSALLIIVLLVIMTLTVMGVGTLYFAGMHSESAIRARAGSQAFYVAEAGVNHGMELVESNPSLIQGYETQGYGGPEDDLVLQEDGSDVTYAGSGPASAAIRIGPSPDAQGQTIQCGLQGFSERFGAPRFQIDSLGNGPAGAIKEIEAHAMLAPREGMCPPGTMTLKGYKGGG